MDRNIDTHLGTGVYTPEKYWSARAKNCDGDYHKAVCAYVATRTENRSMDRVQRYFIKIPLAGLSLRGKSVLEYGCGVGRWIKLFRERDNHWTGVDISDEMLSIAAARFPGVNLAKVEDGFRIPFTDDSFDLIYSITVLHHNDYEQQEKIIVEMARVLKDGGAMILLEDLGGESSFNMFARSKNSWLELVERHQMRNVWYREITYWILRDLEMFEKHIRTSLLRKYWRKMIGFADLLFDPYLLLMGLPTNPRAAIMVFEKQKKVEISGN